MLVLTNDGCLLRLDHNQVHAGRLGTHIQSDVDKTLLRWLSPDEVNSPPLEGEVSLQHVKIACLRGAAILGIDIQGVDWIDPPEGE